MIHPLKNQVVLVTRPREQADQLAQQLRDFGAKVVCFPTLEIRAYHNSSHQQSVLNRLSEYDLAIFISRNAVSYGVPLLRSASAELSVPAIAAIGPATGKALADLGIEVSITSAADSQSSATLTGSTAAGRFDSEALLQHEALAQIAGKKILIVRGQGGRTVLANELRARGAKVDYLECYQRVLPDSNRASKLDLVAEAVTTIVCTSNETLENLVKLVAPEQQDYMRTCQLVVFSERASQLAKELGFQQPARVTQATTEAAIIEALLQLTDASGLNQE